MSKRIYFCIIFIFFFVPKAYTDDLDLKDFNSSIVDASLSIKKLDKKLVEKLIAKVGATEKIFLANKKNTVEDLLRYSNLLAYTTFVSVLNKSVDKDKLENFWINLSKKVTAGHTGYQMNPFVLPFFQNVESQLTLDEYAEAISTLMDLITPNGWYNLGYNFGLHPCTNFRNIGLEVEATKCFENIQTQIPSLKLNKKQYGDFLLDLINQYAITGNTKALLKLESDSFYKDNEFELKILQYTRYRLEMDFKKAKSVLDRAKNLVNSSQDPVINYYRYATDLSFHTYLSTGDLSTAENVIGLLNKEKRLKSGKRFKRKIAFVYGGAGKWDQVYKMINGTSDFGNPKDLSLNVLFCISSYYTTKNLETNCTNYFLDMKKKMVNLKKIHWSYAKYSYLFLLFEKKITLHQRKEIKTYLETNNVKKYLYKDAIITALLELYLKL